MCNLETYKIDLNSLAQGVTTFEYSLDNAYFEAIEESDIRGGNIHADVVVTRSDADFTLEFSIRGTVVVACDLCLDDIDQPVDTSGTLKARLDDEDTEGDDCVVVCRNDGFLDVAWLIYEFVALAVPVRHVHESGECNPEMLDVLKSHSASSDNAGKPADSRWSELEKLKTILKD